MVPASAATGGRCSICAKEVDVAYRPFCSKRCADVDLGRWLQGTYAIAGNSSDSDEDGDDAHAAQQQPASAGEGSRREDG